MGGKKLLNRSGKGMSLSKDIFFTNRSQKLQNGPKRACFYLLNENPSTNSPEQD